MFEVILRFLVVFNVLKCVNSHYTNEWAVEIDGGVEKAKLVASQRGFQYVNEIIPGFYSFRHHNVMKRSLNSHQGHHSSLASHSEVKWVEQQRAKKRVKRDLIPLAFNDPLWDDSWYMHSSSGNDMRVTDVYSKYNITGRGIKVTILDDGLEKNHTDLAANYDAGSSYDVNADDGDPQPTYDTTDENRHGTRCAGEVASIANNGVCGVGIAYNAKIGGVRMLDGDVTDSVEARSLGLNPNHIDIYSISWGPEDNGATVDGPGNMARQAILNGITKGRNNLGNIFVWASGNGGLKGDSCSCDGYCNSIYTLTVSSATESGTVPWYSEPCANTMASTYSSGSHSQRSILTTDLRGKCTNSHTGTSATAPLVAGICALVLEANPRLNWRDVQYIVFLSARQGNLQADDWVDNGVGRKVSHHFGYGLMDATRMVEMAFNWTTIPQQHNCYTYHSDEHKETMISPDSKIQSSIITNGCQPINNNGSNNNDINVSTSINDTTNDQNSSQIPNNNNNPPQNTGDPIFHLEHVECIVNLKAKKRGQVELFLVSPKGTKSQLLIKRSSDNSGNGFVQWAFMSTHSWGEDPRGEWWLEMVTHNSDAILSDWFLNFYGVETRPAVYDRYLPYYQSPTSSPLSYNNNNNNNNNNDNNNRTMHEKPCSTPFYLHRSLCVSNCPLNYYRYDHVCLPCNNLNNNNNPSQNTNYSLIDCSRTRNANLSINQAKSQDLSFYIIAILISTIIVIVSLLALSRCLYVLRVNKINRFHTMDDDNGSNYNNTNNKLKKSKQILSNNSNNNNTGGFYKYMNIPKFGGGGDDDDESKMMMNNKNNKNAKSFLNGFSINGSGNNNNKCNISGNNGSKPRKDLMYVPLLDEISDVE